MSASDFERFARPTLGALPEFDVEEKAASQRAALPPHLTPEAKPEWAAVFRDLQAFTDQYQERYGMAPSDLSPSSVHILTGEDIGQLTSLLGSGDHRGLYDPWTGIAYAQECEESPGERALIDLFYVVTHEVGHKQTHGLAGVYRREDDSFALREGLAEKFAGEFFHTVFLPRYAPATAAAIAQQFARTDQSPYSFAGLPLNAEEVMFTNPQNLHAVGFGRIVEARIATALEAKLGPAAFAELMRRTQASDARPARDFIASELGAETWQLLTRGEDQATNLAVLSELQK